ncbi:MAG: hypothetical protein RSH52_08835 [Janthinobacterium sp.]
MLWFLPQERLAMKSLFAALYGPVFWAGFIGAANFLIAACHASLWVLPPLLLLALFTSFFAERYLPYDGAWNDGHGDGWRDIVHALVNEALDQQMPRRVDDAVELGREGRPGAQHQLVRVMGVAIRGACRAMQDGEVRRQPERSLPAILLQMRLLRGGLRAIIPAAADSFHGIEFSGSTYHCIDEICDFFNTIFGIARAPAVTYYHSHRLPMVVVQPAASHVAGRVAV